MMKKNVHVFFIVGTASVAGVFIFFVGATPRAHAYEISSTAAVGGNYDVGGSLQNLISPFKGFINDLQWTNSTPIDLHLTSTPLPPLNIAGVLENIARQYLSQFNTWFAQSTGIQLSGIVLLVLNVISWTLHAAQDLVNWLLGLFH
jgi:hypothetical protein